MTELGTNKYSEIINDPKWNTGVELRLKEKFARSIGLSKSHLNKY